RSWSMRHIRLLVGDTGPLRGCAQPVDCIRQSPRRRQDIAPPRLPTCYDDGSPRQGASAIIAQSMAPSTATTMSAVSANEPERRFFPTPRARSDATREAARTATAESFDPSLDPPTIGPLRPYGCPLPG